MRKAVFFDLDGTIIDITHKIPLPTEAVRSAIRRLQEAGHYAFVATGRPYSFIEQGLLDLGFDGFVLMSYLDGKSYQEIAVDLDRHVKSIDNALQRVKRKLERYMENRGDEIDITTVYRGLSTINHRMHDALDAQMQRK